jgi:hypothetical protein
MSDAMRPFFEAARAHRLVIQRCTACGTYRFPARELCSRCLARDAAWVPASGRGKVFSYGVVHQVYHPAFAADVPYAVVVVELEEGVRLTTNLLDCPLEAVRIGLPVEVCFEDRTPEVSLPQFRPAEGPGGGAVPRGRPGAR